MTKKKTRNHPDELLIGLVSISDRASSGVYEDQGVPALRDWFSQALSSPWQMETRLIPDEQSLIEKTLIELVGRTEAPKSEFTKVLFPAPVPPNNATDTGDGLASAARHSSTHC